MCLPYTEVGTENGIIWGLAIIARDEISKPSTLKAFKRLLIERLPRAPGAAGNAFFYLVSKGMPHKVWPYTHMRPYSPNNIQNATEATMSSGMDTLAGICAPSRDY